MGVTNNGMETIDGWLTEITADIEGVGAQPEAAEHDDDDDIEIIECAPIRVPLRTYPREPELVRIGFLYATILVTLLCAATTFLGT